MNVVVASVEKSARVLASSGTKIVADKLISAISDSIYDLIILPVRLSFLFLFNQHFHEFSKKFRQMYLLPTHNEMIFVGPSLALIINWF